MTPRAAGCNVAATVCPKPEWRVSVAEKCPSTPERVARDAAEGPPILLIRGSSSRVALPPRLHQSDCHDRESNSHHPSHTFLLMSKSELYTATAVPKHGRRPSDARKDFRLQGFTASGAPGARAELCCGRAPPTHNLGTFLRNCQSGGCPATGSRRADVRKARIFRAMTIAA
jgi:hypothetical protein